jgi:phosphopantothenoylcysteine synthetase/decarboxylase
MIRSKEDSVFPGLPTPHPARGASQRRSPRTGARILPSRTAYTTGVANVLVGVTGGIAAYKAPGVIRRLREADHEVRVVATEAAFRFIPEETLSIVAGAGVHTDETWWERSGKVEHVSLARWSDLVLVAPATADAMARVAVGFGDDLLSATILAGAKKVLWAPAMNPEMWGSPATRRNVETLKGWGHRFVGPAEGLMASVEEEPGVGRLAEEPQIVAAAEEALADRG